MAKSARKLEKPNLKSNLFQMKLNRKLICCIEAIENIILFISLEMNEMGVILRFFHSNDKIFEDFSLINYFQLVLNISNVKSRNIQIHSQLFNLIEIFFSHIIIIIIFIKLMSFTFFTVQVLHYDILTKVFIKAVYYCNLKKKLL